MRSESLFRFALRAVVVAVLLLLVPVSLAQGTRSGISDEECDPIRERARDGMTGLTVGQVAPSSGFEAGGSGSSEGPWSTRENEGLEIEGRVAWESSYNGAKGVSGFSAERIMNYRTTASGFLRLQLWATKTRPVYGGSITFNNLGYIDMNPVAGGFYLENVMTSDRPYDTPAAGTYYISLVLLEYQNGKYLYTDIRTFDETWTIGGASPVCSPTTSRFCAQNNRFSVSLWARDQRTGKTDTGHVMLTTGVYGMFGFPVIAGNTTDPQIFVKVLDGRPINGKWWVFCSTLTDVEFKVTVTDTQTSQSRTYHKLPGATTSTFDTSAF
jgi:hypothetical protein